MIRWVQFSIAEFFILITGVSHAEELQFLFPIGRELFYTSLPSKEDELMREAIVQLWVNFATYGYGFTPLTSG